MDNLTPSSGLGRDVLIRRFDRIHRSSPHGVPRWSQ
jgi:hypothetical protein